ncbi:ATP-dependent Clp protease ATP-binding subunit ClpX [bacterium]|nr:MAG: ATP-dependent Clp protease ATP-binding subunit ClpX [bacterium]RIK64962.1 MAG: ATP-dependent Clp protease ATP-binding subunit ClpX [Planctomycetota bacterium]
MARNTDSTQSQKPLERCSFCAKSRRQVDSLIQGPPGIYICNECIALCNAILQQEKNQDAKPLGEITVETLPSPAQLKAALDQHIVGQEKAKRVLCVAVHNHYKRLLQASKDEDGVEIEKSNILLVGPTGSGKTLLAKTLADLLHVPFAIGDATTLTEAGYVGEDVENLLLKLLQAAEFDLKKAQMGIIFIDEIDKIHSTSQNVSITRDVSGQGVQESLLKMMEGTTANVPPQGGRKHPEQSYIHFDTTNVLFICGGTFVGIEEFIRARLGTTSMRIQSRRDSEATATVTAAAIRTGREEADVHERNRLRHLLEPEDLVKFGMIPEFIGRLPVISTLDELDRATLIHVLTHPKNAITKQFRKLFRMHNHELEFQPEALNEIADQAIKRGTGARGLRGIVEKFMLDAQFELPGIKEPRRFVVTADVVRGKQNLVDSCVKVRELPQAQQPPASAA